MNTDFRIRIEGLSKRYTLERSGESRPVTLRDKISQSLNIKRRLKSFREQKEDYWALRDIDFDVTQGERVAIIGENGAGKSTLLKILSRIVEPTLGRIQIRGRVASLLEVGTGFHPELTGRENIYLNGAILGMSRGEIKGKFDEIVEFSEIERFLETPVKRYSSGMYVRLAFSVAAHLEPEILIVDEVLAVGDARFQEKCLGKMESIGRDGRTVLFVSHNMAAVSMLCTRGILLSRGKLVSDDTIGATIASYQSMLSSRSVRERIEDFQNRQGSGEARVTSVRLSSKEDRNSGFIEMGEPFEITLTLVAKPEVVGKKCKFTIIVVDKFDVRLCALQNELESTEILLRAETIVTCSVPQGLNFVPGPYALHLSLHVGGGLSDKLLRAIDFQIFPRKFFPANLLPDEALGKTLVRSSWFANQSIYP